jgi:hypothetical protein
VLVLQIAAGLILFLVALQAVMQQYSVSGLLSPPCGPRVELQDATHVTQLGSHIWLTI